MRSGGRELLCMLSRWALPRILMRGFILPGLGRDGDDVGQRSLELALLRNFTGTAALAFSPT